MEEGKEEQPEVLEETEGAFDGIKKALAEDRVYEAQMLLDKIEEHGAEWHYWQAQACKKKSWFLEGYRHMQEAVKLDPENETYSEELEELERMSGGKDESEPKKKRKARKKDMGSGSGWNDACGECCLEGCCMCACEGLCEGICEGC